MSAAPPNKHLVHRARMLRAVREFFHDHGVLEVDCSALTLHPSIDAHIDLIQATVLGERAFLHSSPEYGMKGLLSEGIGDIYQLSHVFRDGERGMRHRPEFMMIEWYRAGFSLQEMMEEAAHLIALFVGEKPLQVMSYTEAFKEFAGVDWEGPIEDLEACAGRRGVRSELISYILATVIEPKLTGDTLYAITHFPKSESALAKVTEQSAMRFEIFYQGVELANGYDELNDPVEQKKRLEENNRERERLGKEVYPETIPIPGPFAECCGVAVGFDRLLMLQLGVSDIGSVLP